MSDSNEALPAAVERASAPATLQLQTSRERLRETLLGNAPHRRPLTGARRDTPAYLLTRIAARRSVQLVADRHPLPLVTVAMAAGALLVLLRPWRWLLRPAVIAGIASRALASVPVERVIQSLLTAPRRDVAPPPETPPTPAPRTPFPSSRSPS